MAKLIHEANISLAWKCAKDYIIQNGLDCNDLMVTIDDPLIIDPQIHSAYKHHCQSIGIAIPDKVSNTIFPKRSFEIVGHNRQKLYNKYPKIHKVLKGRWGSYFGQMINYREGNTTSKNQLEDIINMINTRPRVLKAAYILQIPNPIRHFGWPRGLPCLNNIMVQLDSDTRRISFLALYRSHDFGVKAYGNYIGLGHLLEFIASETGFNVGKVTCVSSRAFITRRHASGIRVI